MKTKDIITLLGGLVLGAVGFQMCFLAESVALPLRIIGFLGFVFFIGGCIFIVAKLLQLGRSHRQAVEFNDQGILLAANHLVEWKDITAFTPLKLQGTRFIVITTRDPQHDIAKEPRWWRRMMMKQNYKLTGGVYNFTEFGTHYSFTELLDACNEQLSRHQHPNT